MKKEKILTGKKIWGIIIIVTGLNITACGGGGGGDPSPDPDPNAASFKFFPDGYFVAGYREEFDFNGTRVNADTNAQLDIFTFDQLIVTQPEGVFNLESVIPVFETRDIGFSNGSSTQATETFYYSINQDDRRYKGKIVTIFGVTTTITSVTTSPIPETVQIGDSGIFGTYLDNFGSRYIISWDISDAANDNATMTWTTNVENAASSIQLSESEDIFIIDVNGNRVSKEIYFESFNLSPNVIDQWTGVKIF